MRKVLILMVGITIISLLLPAAAKAQISDNLLFIEPFGGTGFGADKIETGIRTETSSNVTLNLDGGFTYGLKIGYNCFENFDVYLSWARQESHLSRDVDFFDASFYKHILIPCIMYKHVFLRNGIAGIGAGYRAALGGTMEVDGTKLNNGALNKYRYQDSYSPTIVANLELYVSEVISLNFGCNYYFNSYKIKGITSNGKDIPLSVIPSDLRSAFFKMDGSGLDISFALRFHIYV